MQDIKLYTITIFSENTVGLLGQITSVFVRHQINIETLSVSPSALEGIHKFTITINSTKDLARKLVLQIDKRVDVLKAYYNTDEELVHQEIALYKLSTSDFLKISSVEKLVRKHTAVILDINENNVVIQKTGHYQETQDFFEELNKLTGVLQFIRSGRIAINKSKIERLSDMLAERDMKHKETLNKG